MAISLRILLRMGNVSDRSCTQNENTHFMFGNFFPENRVVYDIMSKSTVEPEKTQIPLWRRVTCWISKATCAQAPARVRAPTLHTRALTPLRARARTHTHTHTH